jgi:hypothetical protein
MNDKHTTAEGYIYCDKKSEGGLLCGIGENQTGGGGGGGPVIKFINKNQKIWRI